MSNLILFGCLVIKISTRSLFLLQENHKRGVEFAFSSFDFRNSLTTKLRYYVKLFNEYNRRTEKYGHTRADKYNWKLEVPSFRNPVYPWMGQFKVQELQNKGTQSFVEFVVGNCPISAPASCFRKILINYNTRRKYTSF